MGFNLITRYPRADYVCIDALEARLAVSDRTGELSRHRAPLPRISRLLRSSSPTAGTAA